MTVIRYSELAKAFVQGEDPAYIFSNKRKFVQSSNPYNNTETTPSPSTTTNNDGFTYDFVIDLL